MKTLFYVIAAIGAVLGGLFLYVTMRESTSAPQEAAGAAISACIVIIPYVFARSFEKFSESGDLRNLLEKQIEQNTQMIALQKKNLGLKLTDQEKALLTE